MKEKSQIMDAVACNSQTWSSVEKRVKDYEEESSDLLTIEPDMHVVVAFVGEPWAYDAFWNDNMNQWVSWATAMVKSPEPALRIRLNVWKKETECMKIWDMDVKSFRQVLKMREKYGLDKWLFEIHRLDDDPAMSDYTVLPEARLDDETASKINVSPRHVLVPEGRS